MRQPNLNALLQFFSIDRERDFISDPNHLVTLRYTFSLKDDEGKEKIYCEIICGDLIKHQTFLSNLAKLPDVQRSFVEYIHEYNGALLYCGEKDVFIDEDEELKEKDGDQ